MADSSWEVCDRQKESVKKLLQTPLQAGATWYLVDTKWFKQWQSYVGYESWDTSLAGDKTAYPGPIDNKPLFKDGTNALRLQLMENIDFTIVPEEAWNSLVQWYTLTEGQEPIARMVIDQGIFNKNCTVEVYLIELRLCHNDTLDSQISYSFSRAATLEQVEKTMRRSFDVADDKEVKLWSKYMSNTYEPLKKLTSTLQEASLFQGQVIVIEVKNDNGTWPRQPKFAFSPGAIGDMPLSSSSSSATRGYGASPADSNSESFSNNGCRHFVTPGLCGLSNLGNTCFMNSAIQCMSNVLPLTEYMLSGKWKEELNCDNPLGMNGEIATSYAELIKNMWSGKHTCTVPRQFKVAVGRFKPEFSGYQQQDSQELMAFLLDGLHEDLNRIRQKPYIEMKEAENRPDKEVSKEVWQDYIRRNNSVIVDTFHGLLKSTLVCPECNKVSVKFDPFCYLSLPLPIKKERQIIVFFVPLNPKLKIRQCKVTVPKMGVIGDLNHAMSALTGAPYDRLVVADVYNHRFHKFYSAQDLLSNITERDDIFVFEVPVSTAEDPETIVIPVYMREVKGTHGHYSSGYTQLFGQPLLVPFPRNSCTYDVIYNCLLDVMARYVKNPDENDDNASVDVSENSSSSSFDKQDFSSGQGDEGVTNANEFDAFSSKEKEISEEIESADVVAAASGQKTTTTKRIFSFRLVNSYGSTDFDRVIDDGKPIKFSSHSYLAADWSYRAKELYYDDKEAEAIDVDETMNQKPLAKKTIQLSDCLELFTTMEKLGEQDPWYCPVCKKHQQATKKFDIWSLPKTLVIHLKRFSYSRYWRDKLDTFIDYPTRALDMSRFVINPEHGPAVFDLIAVSNHYGGMGGGHYTAYGKNNEHWYSFDDSNVSSTSEEAVVTKAGYVLVYQLRGSVAASSNATDVTIPAKHTTSAAVSEDLSISSDMSDEICSQNNTNDIDMD